MAAALLTAALAGSVLYTSCARMEESYQNASCCAFEETDRDEARLFVLEDQPLPAPLLLPEIRVAT